MQNFRGMTNVVVLNIQSEQNDGSFGIDTSSTPRQLTWQCISILFGTLCLCYFSSRKTDSQSLVFGTNYQKNIRIFIIQFSFIDSKKERTYSIPHAYTPTSWNKKKKKKKKKNERNAKITKRTEALKHTHIHSPELQFIELDGAQTTTNICLSHVRDKLALGFSPHHHRHPYISPSRPARHTICTFIFGTLFIQYGTTKLKAKQICIHIFIHTTDDARLNDRENTNVECRQQNTREKKNLNDTKYRGKKE